MLIELTLIIAFMFIGLTFLRFEHHAQKIKIAVIILVGFILFFSIANIFNSSQVDTSSPSGILNGVYLYIGWIGQTSSSLWNIGTETVHMVGNAIKVNNTEQKEQKRR